MAFACSEAGTLVPVDAGVTDATESHDTVFVPQVDNDGPDDAMEAEEDAGADGDATDAGVAAEAADVDVADVGDEIE
jgi:hypothetical protein